MGGGPVGHQDQLADGRPTLVVFDTLSSLFGAYGESNDGAPEVIAQLIRLRDDFGCSVLLTHHSGWGNRERARGASALEANVDDVLAVTGSAGLVSLFPTKRRDSAIDTTPIQLKVLAVQPDVGAGSAVLTLSDTAPTWAERILAALAPAGEQGLTTAQLRKAVGLDGVDAKGLSAFKTALGHLRTDGRVEGPRGRNRLTVGG